MKRTLSLSIDDDLIEWVKQKAKYKPKIYRNKSHFVENIIKEYKDKNG